MRVFRWEHSVSGGVLVTFVVAELGLVLCAGTPHCSSRSLQVYVCSMGAALMAVNSVVILQRWHSAGQLTRVVAELLNVLGVPLRRQVLTKACLSAAASLTFLLDLFFIPIIISNPRRSTNISSISPMSERSFANVC
ncbi:uncharacterized protein LOC126979093 isoform X2 [Leptidea sinapis]|nr:uncharacterized protein LOC126979093 isoform X2 [Leptidea sinapis]